MDNTKKLMKQAILLAADSVSDNIQTTYDPEKLVQYSEAMLKLTMALAAVKNM